MARSAIGQVVRRCRESRGSRRRSASRPPVRRERPETRRPLDVDVLGARIQACSSSASRSSSAPSKRPPFPGRPAGHDHRAAAAPERAAARRGRRPRRDAARPGRRSRAASRRALRSSAMVGAVDGRAQAGSVYKSKKRLFNRGLKRRLSSRRLRCVYVRERWGLFAWPPIPPARIHTRRPQEPRGSTDDRNDGTPTRERIRASKQ